MIVDGAGLRDGSRDLPRGCGVLFARASPEAGITRLPQSSRRVVTASVSGVRPEVVWADPSRCCGWVCGGELLGG